MKGPTGIVFSDGGGQGPWGILQIAGAKTFLVVGGGAG